MHASTPRSGWWQPAAATNRTPHPDPDATDRAGRGDGGRLAAHLDGLRRARAALAWLFHPDAPALRDLLTRYRVSEAFDRLADPSTIAAADLRHEVRTSAARDVWAAAAGAVADAPRVGVRVVIPEDDEWPAGLADLARADRDPTAPAALCSWVRGARPLAATLARSVAVVGARAASPYGVQVATDLAAALADRGWTVVATGGYGIDSAAHRAALTTATPTVAVQAGGLDRPHTADVRELLDRIAGHGLLVSPWPPGAVLTRDRMASTQRLIAALTSGTVVVEASVRSGALSTLYQAINLGRPAMAVPGPVTSVTSAGCHQILRDCPQVRLVTGTDDVLDQLPHSDPMTG